MKIRRLYCFRDLLWCLVAVPLLLGKAQPTAAQQPVPTPMPEAANRSETGQFITYLPLLVRSGDVDLTIASVEVTQAIQTPTHSVPMVAGRPTVMRVYAQTNKPDPVQDVYVSVSAYRGGTLLSGSPLLIGPGTVYQTWSRSDPNTSFNAQLPQAWLSGDVTLEAMVDHKGAILEKDITNNTKSIALSFHSVPALNVTVVPIIYEDVIGGQVYPAPSSDYIQQALMRFYPVEAVNVSVHSEFYFQGDLNASYEWERLLDEITVLKQTESVPYSQVYYGVVPVLDEGGFPWYYGGIAGIGWVGQVRASVGLSHTPEWNINGKNIVAHEIGHNLGRRHAPCGVPGDENYPYPGGIIGQFGFDVSAFQVMLDTRTDVMGYCDNVWISDYTYEGLYNDQVIWGMSQPAPQTTDSLLVRARLDDQGQIHLKPLYALPAAPGARHEEGDVTVEFLDESGSLMASHPVAVLQAQEQGSLVRAISAVLPRPEGQVASLRLVQAGEIVASQRLSQASLEKRVQVEVRQTSQGQVLRWGGLQTPALVRYSSDGGQTWTTLAVDVLGGELRLARGTLPRGELRFEVILAE